MIHRLHTFISHYRIAILLSIVATVASLGVTRTEVACMFCSSRYYGWPNSVAVLSKVTDSYADAERVHSDSYNNLTRDGWKLHFSSDWNGGQYGFFSLGFFNLLFNYLMFLIPLSVLVYVGRWIRGIKY